MNANKEWDALSTAWQQQATPAIDFDALRREASRRGRRLRWTVYSEIVLTGLVVAFCLAVLVTGNTSSYERTLFGGMAAMMVAYQGYMVWLRRREWNETGLDAAALLDLELRRCDTVRYYWRFGMWTVLALWLVLYGVWLWSLGQQGADSLAGGLMGGLYANVVVVPVMGLYGIWRSRLARLRRERLLALREQLAGG